VPLMPFTRTELANLLPPLHVPRLTGGS